MRFGTHAITSALMGSEFVKSSHFSTKAMAHMGYDGVAYDNAKGNWNLFSSSGSMSVEAAAHANSDIESKFSVMAQDHTYSKGSPLPPDIDKS